MKLHCNILSLARCRSKLWTHTIHDFRKTNRIRSKRLLIGHSVSKHETTNISRNQLITMSSGRYAEQTSTPSERKPDVTKAKAGSYSICFHCRQKCMIKDFFKVIRFFTSVSLSLFIVFRYSCFNLDLLYSTKKYVLAAVKMKKKNNLCQLFGFIFGNHKK